MAVAGALAPRAARAEVRETAARVAEQWRLAGGSVTSGPTRFLYEDETMTVVVPPGEGACIRVALIGARGISFHVKVSGLEDDPLALEPTARASSMAGVLEIGRCESDAPGPGVSPGVSGVSPDHRISPDHGEPMRRLVVTSDAGRGAIETVVARSKVALPSLKTILPERSGGALPPSPEPGTLPPLGAPTKRAEIAEGRARRDGGLLTPRASFRAGADGNGEGRLALEAGCHRIEFFASDPRSDRAGRRFRLDIDAELRDEDDDTMLGRDRSDAADAHINACVGNQTNGVVVFAGAPPSGAVTVTHAWWPIPPRIPVLWGPEARARMASAMLARHVATPPSTPVALAQGSSGNTPVPFDVEPGACYLAVATVTHGHARGLGLRAHVGARQASDERGMNDESGAVAFCVRDRSHVVIDVEARGAALAWGIALFRIEGRIWGEVER
jgi:hypothetical protein